MLIGKNGDSLSKEKGGHRSGRMPSIVANPG
jgi:hypothetical protein